MTRALVLGAGLIGTFAARAIGEAGAEVVAIDLSPDPAYFARFGPRGGEAALIPGDVRDESFLRKAVAAVEPDVIVLSISPSEPSHLQEPAATWEMNVDVPRRVAEAAIENGARRLVFLSSFAVYGRTEGLAVSEDAPAQPRSHYGRAKLAGEWVLAPFRGAGLDVRVVRPCGVFGPLPRGRGSRSARLVSAALRSATGAGEVAIPGSLVDEYLYVKDVARALSLVALRDGPDAVFTFNVGSERITTAEELARAVGQAVPGARISITADSAEPTSRVPLDAARIRAAYDFRPEHDLGSALKDMIDEMELAA